MSPTATTTANNRSSNQEEVVMEGPNRLYRALVAVTLILAAAGAARAQQASPGEKSLYERLGGLPAIAVVVNDFIDALVPDEEMNRNPAIREARARVPAPYLKYHVTAMVCQATGGPCQYGGRTMKESHAHLHITAAEWDRMATLFKGVLDKYKVPAKEQGELFAIVGTTRGDIVESKP
jgi:hemoglobin